MSVPFPPPPSEITTSRCLRDPSDFPEPPGRMSLRVLSAGSSAGTLQKPCRFAKERFGSEQGRQQKREGRAGPHARDVGTASAAGAPPGRCRGFAPLLLSRLGVQEPPPHAAPARKRGASICTQNHAGVVLRAGSQAGAPPHARAVQKHPGRSQVPLWSPSSSPRPGCLLPYIQHSGPSWLASLGAGWGAQEPGVEAAAGRCRRQDWFLCLVCK